MRVTGAESHIEAQVEVPSVSPRACQFQISGCPVAPD
jgi:hypothetical protein